MGRSIVERFAREGAKVAIGTRGAEAGAAAVAAVEAKGGVAALFPLDVGERAAVSKLVQKTVDRFGAIDILVHNAAVMPHGAGPGEIEDATLDRMFAVNVKAAFWLLRDALPYLRKSTAGRVLVTSSLAGNSQNYPGMSDYGASKAALNGFVRSVALDLAPLRITVNGIEPGLIMTDHVANAANADDIADYTRRIPLGRTGAGEEIANLMLFLASDDAAYITGRIIPVDGGLSLGPATFDVRYTQQ